MDNKEMIEILIKKLEEKEQGIESNLNTYNNLLNELTDAYDSLEEIDINDYEETYNILRKIADKYHINYFLCINLLLVSLMPSFQMEFLMG